MCKKCFGRTIISPPAIVKIFSRVKVARHTIGTCEQPVLVVSDPVPLPAFVGTGWENMVFTELAVEMPLPDINYRFQAYLVDAEGNMSTDYLFGGMYPFPVPYDYVSCGEAVIMRGTLLPFYMKSLTYDIFVTPCTDGCWGDPEPMHIATVYVDDPLYDFCFLGPVDLFGTTTENTGMMDLFPFVITGVQLAPEGVCGPIPTNSESWGGIKAMYR